MVRADLTILPERCENMIVLSDEFFQEVIARPIPANLEVVKLLFGRLCISSRIKHGQLCGFGHEVRLSLTKRASLLLNTLTISFNSFLEHTNVNHGFPAEQR